AAPPRASASQGNFPQDDFELAGLPLPSLDKQQPRQQDGDEASDSFQVDLAAVESLIESGNAAAGAAILQDAVKLRPRDASARVLLARAYLKVDEREAAEQELLSARDLIDNPADARLLDIARLLRQADDE